MKQSSSPLIGLAIAALATSAQADSFTLRSAEFRNSGTIAQEQAFNGFGCTGGNVSPSLSWSGAPAGTKSFALFVHDPDAPTGGSGWWHWVVTNIPANVTHLAKGAGNADGSALPSGAHQIATDFGVPGWGGPCPPMGDKPHRYHFKLVALKVERLDLPPQATAALAGFMAHANALGSATLTGRFGR
jgi:Raf kinase inhibitor-like YbhB/YbcL family protein